MARIALVDDDRNVLTSLTMVLEAEGFTVGAYHDSLKARDSLHREQYDMAILDIKMPKMDGFELLQDIRKNSMMPVIFLTSKKDEIDEVFGLRIGADDYIHKPFNQRILIERIRVLLRRQNFNAQSLSSEHDTLLNRGFLLMDLARHFVSWKGVPLSLTVTEFLLLKALAQRPSVVKSRDQLMKSAYDDAYVDDRTVDTHIKRLRKKIRAIDADFNAIETLYGLGYRYVDVAVA